MAEGFVHTGQQGWTLDEQRRGRPGKLPDSFDTKEDAVEAGRAEARRRKTEHVIHDEDGSIAERNSYGKRPVGQTRLTPAE